MNENEWTDSTDPEAMIAYLRDQASDRKIRLFVVACCRRLEDLTPHQWSRRAIEVGERFADGLASEQERLTARDKAFSVDRLLSSGQVPEVAKEYLFYQDRIVGIANFIHASYAAAFAADKPGFTINPDGVELLWGVRAAVQNAAQAVADLDLTDGPDRNPNDEDCWWATDKTAYDAEREAHCELLRDIFGNPFHAVALSPLYRSATVVTLARKMYDSRNFSAMPLFADALQNAGCDNADILDHCRSSGPHVRGCWVLDFVLDKE